MQSQSKSNRGRSKFSTISKKSLKKKSQTFHKQSSSDHFISNSCNLGQLLQNKIVSTSNEKQTYDEVLLLNQQNIISIKEALSLYKSKQDQFDCAKKQEHISTLKISELSQKMYHLGSKKNCGAFFRGDQCEKIISIIDVNCQIFNNSKNKVAILEWKQRNNGIKPDISSERLSFIEKNYPELLEKFQSLEQDKI